MIKRSWLLLPRQSHLFTFSFIHSEIYERDMAFGQSLVLKILLTLKIQWRFELHRSRSNGVAVNCDFFELYKHKRWLEA